MYEQIYKVLKPGGRFCSYEWVCTPEYDEKNPKHKEIVDEICRGNGLPVANHKQDVLDAAEEVGFDVVLEEDLAPSSEIPWCVRSLLIFFPLPFCLCGCVAFSLISCLILSCDVGSPA